MEKVGGSGGAAARLSLGAPSRASWRRRARASSTPRRASSRSGGFDGATVTAIAAAADVAPETVYANFGTRGRCSRARAACCARPRGRAGAGAGRSGSPCRDYGSREQLRLFASDIVVRLERVGPLLEVLAAAARADGELAQLLSRIHAERRANLATFVAALTANGACGWSRTTPSTPCGRSQARSCTVS